MKFQNLPISLIIGLCCIFSFTGFAQDPGFTTMENIEAFEQNTRKVAESTNTITSDFVQEKNLAIMEEKIVSKGKFHFKKVSSIRWEYKDPFTYLIVIKDGEIFIKDEGNENTFDMKSNKVFKGINDMIVNSVQGKILDDQNFKISYYQNNTQYMVQLIPLDEKMKDFLSKIQVYFDKNDYSVVKVKMMELSDDYTSIEFINRKINQPVSDENFSFK